MASNEHPWIKRNLVKVLAGASVFGVGTAAVAQVDDGDAGADLSSIELTDSEATSQAGERLQPETGSVGVATDDLLSDDLDDIDETVDGTDDTVDDTIDGTDDSIDDTIDGTDDSIDDTIDGTDDSIDDTIDAADDSVDSPDASA